MVITIIFFYDEKLKCSNNKSFLLVTISIGKYGRSRKRYLKENQKVEYMLMRANNELTSHLLDIDDICKKRVERLIKNRAEEIVLNGTIYK